MQQLSGHTLPPVLFIDQGMTESDPNKSGRGELLPNTVKQLGGHALPPVLFIDPDTTDPNKGRERRRGEEGGRTG